MWEPDCDDDDLADFISSLVCFWLKEIKDRGYTIHGLLNGSDDFFGIELSLKSLVKLNYPPKYGNEQ
jgi:hypothetical protein